MNKYINQSFMPFVSEVQKAKFNAILRDIRSDLTTINNLHAILLGKVQSGILDDDIIHWIYDVYLDKIYELEAKIRQVNKDIYKGQTPHTLTSTIHSLAAHASTLHEAKTPNDVTRYLSRLTDNINDLNSSTELDLSFLRRGLINAGWEGLENIKPAEYVSLTRKKYLTAREELNKAKQHIKTSPEDVMSHLRTAIDLAIKERFGFTQIPKMILFIEQAEKLDFPLPSYDLIYTYFSEGTQRIHAGKIHTTFEALEVIRTVSNFVDELELVQVSKEQIDKFVRDCKCVRTTNS